MTDSDDTPDSLWHVSADEQESPFAPLADLEIDPEASREIDQIMADDETDSGGGIEWWHLVATALGCVGVGVVVGLLVARTRGRSTEPTDTADQLDDATDDAMDTDQEPTDDALKDDLESLA